MDTVKKLFPSWHFVAGVAIIALLVALLTPLVIVPLLLKAKGKFSRGTPLIVAALGLALCLGAMPTYAGPVADTSPTMLAAQTQHFHGTLATVSGEGLAVTAISAAVFGVAWFLSRRSRFSISIAASLALAVGVLFFPVKSYAADKVERFITSIVMNAGRSLDATNGFLRVYGPSGTNWWAELTNGQWVVQHPTGLSTGFTGITTISNGNVTATQLWHQGRLLSTNFAGATPANLK